MYIYIYVYVRAHTLCWGLGVTVVLHSLLGSSIGIIHRLIRFRGIGIGVVDPQLVIAGVGFRVWKSKRTV